MNGLVPELSGVTLSYVEAGKNSKSPDGNSLPVQVQPRAPNSKKLLLFVFIALVVDKTGRPARHKLHWYLIDQRVAGERGQSQRLYMGPP